jgi:alkylation response protein AidB-like acyl-CoA dehydrogenase
MRYDEEHAQLQGEARRWLTQRMTSAELRRLTTDARGDAPTLWRELASLGWTGLVIPERQGGAGLGALYLAVLAEETGRRLLPAPLVPTLLAAKLIERAGDAAQRERWLPGVARGDTVATVAQVEPSGAWDALATSAVLERGHLTGTKHHVWAAGTAGLLLVPARERAELRLVLVRSDAAGITIEPELGLDPSRRTGRVLFVNAACETLAGDAEAAYRGWLPWAWLALAAEMAGGADAALTLTAAYAATRTQFDKPIGSFQAIKHPLVNVLIAVEQLRTLVYAAASALDAGDPEADRLARMAKAAASEAYPFACSRAVQFHGGYGFTEDCDAHLYLRRALASRPAFGDGREHRAAIAALLLSPDAAHEVEA